ncbi:tetratricopeptide repeat protein [Nocardiopsis baichengensis]|uniref:hypothetical protein n=1 Tax=Nocardiopsis baichengensis TaxID=280240 RepID=UPI00034BE378|nr:hypothetical protein [Nocardiopsis baichengensis]
MSDLARTRSELLRDVLFSEHTTAGTGSEGIEKAVNRARALLEPESRDAWPHYLLGLALAMRYLDSGAQADIDGGLEHLREAIRLGGSEDPHAAMYRQQLAGTLGAQWAASALKDPGKDPTELRESLRLAREALEMTDAGSPHLPVRLLQVAEFLGQGADGPDRLDEALEFAERALQVAHPDDPRMSKYQHTHAQLLLHIAAGKERKAGAAVEAERSAIRAGHLAHPYDPTQTKIVGTLQRARLLQAG